jgi:putative ABC transport system substrate-binding protein
VRPRRNADDAPVAAARALGVTLQIRDIQSRAEGLLTTAESMFSVHRARVIELAARHRLPAMYCYSTHVVDAGGLMAYDINSPDLQRRDQLDEASVAYLRTPSKE